MRDVQHAFPIHSAPMSDMKHVAIFRRVWKIPLVDRGPVPISLFFSIQRTCDISAVYFQQGSYLPFGIFFWSSIFWSPKLTWVIRISGNHNYGFYPWNIFFELQPDSTVFAVQQKVSPSIICMQVTLPCGAHQLSGGS